MLLVMVYWYKAILKYADKNFELEFHVKEKFDQMSACKGYVQVILQCSQDMISSKKVSSITDIESQTVAKFHFYHHLTTCANFLR